MDKLTRSLSSETTSFVVIAIGGLIGGFAGWALLIAAASYLMT